jgi:serine/threonine-protein kinase
MTEPLDRPRWQQVAAILDAVLDSPTGERGQAVERLCGGDLALRREVETLLAADRAAGDFLEVSAGAFAASHFAEPVESPDPVGAIVGRYRLIEEIGRGGMGVVWLAERADGQFEQRVALKLVRRGVDSAELQDRFRRERQIMARLEHPNIARLLDGGISEDGRVYFVMEFVAGMPLTRHCDAGRLSIEQRIDLFVAVCRAVQYAHRNLIVHRDIKPSNVLVTPPPAGEVRLLDFGVAALLDEQDEDLASRTGGPVTPAYASPEQLRGHPVSTASDVYQLGVLLYELLSGQRPYDLAGLSAREIDRAVCETTPPLPSRAVQEPARQRRLRGDLDAIVMRALQKDPTRRYASPEALAEDLERHLAHLPLRTGGESRRSRTAKFVRRNRAWVIPTALALSLAALATVGYVLQIRAERDRTRYEAAKSAENAALLASLFWDWNPDAANRREISAASLLGVASRRAATELQGRPEVLASILSVLGDLHAAVGQSGPADSLLTQALAIQERLPATFSLDLATTLGRRGRLLMSSGRYRDAVPLLRRAHSLFLARLPAERTEVLNVQLDLATSLRTDGSLDEAEALFRNGMLIVPAASVRLSSEFASSLGYTLFLEGRYEEAATLLRTTLNRQRESFGRVHLLPLRTMRYLGSALRDQGKLVESEQLNREALEITEALFGRDHPETRFTMVTLALVLERRGLFGEAERFARGALDRTRRDPRADTPLEFEMMATLAGILVARGSCGEAEPMFRRVLAALRPAANNEIQGDLLNRLAFCLALRGAGDADEVYRRAVAFEAARPASGPFFVTDGYHYLAEVARRRGDREIAERLYQRALDLYERQLPGDHPYRVMTDTGLGRLRLKDSLPPPGW